MGHMDNFASNYYEILNRTVKSAIVTERGGSALSLEEGVAGACRIIVESTSSDGTVMFIGNGGSSAISSHMTIDFWKNGGMKAFAFNDTAQLTCLGNDFGYKHVFEKPIEMFAQKGDVLIAISSSGKSPNILAGVEAARKRGCAVITMSGFSSDNPLRSAGDINFYLPSSNYGPVEILHHSLCHCILDRIMVSQGKLKL